MGDITKIQWCDATFNPWIGCAKVAPGCEHCYAEADMDKRRGRVKWGVNGTRSVTSTAYWRKPLKWEREAKAAGVRRRVFCVSLGDVFEDREELKLWRERLFDLIDETPNLDWLLLTKRPENILRMWPLTPGMPPTLVEFDQSGKATGYKQWDRATQLMHRPNVWLGTSISDQATADKAIPKLLKCRDLAPVLFLSAEPLLGPIDLTGELVSSDGFVSALADGPIHVSDGGRGIDWIIVGGESGPNARPCHMEWIRSLVDQCRAIGHPCFVKQLGANAWLDSIAFDAADPGARLTLTDKKGGDPAEWPEDLRVREFPKVTVQQ